VVPRYGEAVLGGAETAARTLAEHLVRQLGWTVEVLTTCALDALTWRDELEPGTEELNGVTVRRFASAAGRAEDFHPYSGLLLQAPEQATAEQAELWIDKQGPRTPALVAAVAAADADVVVFYPYLYYPTVRGLPLVAERSVLHPAAHDEPALALGAFRPVFEQASGLVFHTESERRLVEQRFSVAQSPQLVLGVGVSEHQGDPDAARSTFGLEDRPYLVCVGRIEDLKGTTLLARYFAAYKERRPGPLALVLVGQVIDPPPAHPDVVVCGMVDEEQKWGLLRGALGLVCPSPFESFSLAVIEGWTAGLPVLVNGTCLPTLEHCVRSGGGLWFSDYAHFEVALDRLGESSSLREALADRGRRYVERHFSWPVLIDRYGEFLERVARRSASHTAQRDSPQPAR
jgi:glycosyltransferase involved in cell wall biosynthesis